MDKFSVPTTEKRSLRYDFTAVETHNLSMQLAAKTKEVVTLKKEKTSVTSQCTAKINEAEAACNKLSNQVADGFEMREIECEIQFHQPTQGKKTIIRKDSDTVVGVESMTDADWNLFNQPDESPL